MAEILTLDLSDVHNNPNDFDLDYQDDDDNDEDGVEDIDPLSDDFYPDDNLPSLRRILNYYTSESNENRELCVRLFPDALQTISTMTELNMLCQVTYTLARDHFHIVRIGALSNIPALLEKNDQLERRGEGEEACALENWNKLVDIPISMLTDTEVEVRRMGQNVIVNLLGGDREQEKKDEILEKLYPIIKRCLGRDENYDLRMDAAMLISRMASLIGQNNILKYFVPLLPSLASDTMFHVRKAFVMSCRELFPMIEEEQAEEHLLPLYLKLCKDEVWGVRKASADVFSEVSAACNLGTRYDQLTPAFLKLLHDDSRWVRKAAYQSLGAFISTFYIPNGNQSPKEAEDKDESSLLLSDSFLQDNSLETTVLAGNGEVADSSNTTTELSSDHRHPLPNSSVPPDGEISSSSTPIRASTGVSEVSQLEWIQDQKFSNFEFWKSPIPNIEEEEKKKKKLGIVQGTQEEEEVKARLGFEEAEGGDDEKEKLRLSCKSGGCDELSEKVNQLNLSETAEAIVTNESSEAEKRNSDTSDVSTDCSSSTEERAVKCDEVKGEAISNSAGSKAPPQKMVAETGKLLDKNIVRLRSSSAGATVRRVSVESGLKSERVVIEKKRRRWSLDRANVLNSLPQVRVFIHSTSGEITEQDVATTLPKEEERDSTPDNTCLSEEQEGLASQGEEHDPSGTGLHNYTTTKSEAMDLTLEDAENTTNIEPTEETYIEQEVVPDELMEIYLSMTEQSRVQIVDTDLLYYCAYALPGVTLTLGKPHWTLLKPTFEYLAEDMQWKIRRVLAFSLHELARILGSEITCQDILPIFEGYCTKDVDDVKIGALTHLADFFELLPVDLREAYLPKVLSGLLQMENQKNWRYRNTLAYQLLLLVDLFDPAYLHDHIYPLALQLSTDKVAEVRNSANLLIGALIQRISKESLEKCHTLLQMLRSSLMSNSNWLQRLMYVKQCETFLLNDHISHETFAHECLPSILQLARDRVPNVRIAIAKLLKDTVMKYEYFQNNESDSFSLDELQITLECLQHDADRDVKFFAGGEITETPRLMMMPKKWYAQRTRSESHASSDMEQYQDASEYLDLDTHIGHLSSSPNSKPNLPSATEYLNLDSGSSSISTHVPAHISNPGPSHTITILTTKDVVNLLEFPSAPDTESTSQDDVERILDSSDQRIEGSEDGPNVTSEEVELEKQAEKKEGEDNSEE